MLKTVFRNSDFEKNRLSFLYCTFYTQGIARAARTKRDNECCTEDTLNSILNSILNISVM